MQYKSYLFFVLSFITFSFSACLKGKLSEPLVIKPSYVDSSFTNNFKQENGLTAGIGARSMTLSDGRIFWLFGKSHLNDFNTSTQKIKSSANANNAALIQSSNSFLTLNVGNNDFIPSNEVNTFFTPLHAYQFYDTIFVFAKKEGSNQNNITYIAKFNFPSFQYVGLDSMFLNNTNYGYNLIVDTAVGFCFIYGLKLENASSNNDIFLARFPMNNPRETWVYWNENQWLNHPQNAKSIYQVPSENFSIRKVKSWYVMITQDAGFMCNSGTNIYSFSAGYPYGPFLNKTKLYTIKDLIGNTTPATKQATLHTQFTANDELLVTYSIDGFEPCQTTTINAEDDADYHRIKAIRIPIKNINPNM